MTKPEQAPPDTESRNGAVPAAGGAAARRGSVRRAIGLVAVATLAGAAAGALALYGINRLPGNGPLTQTSTAPGATGPVVAAEAPAADAIDCAPTAARARALEPLATGEIAALKLAAEPKALPPLNFTGKDGKPLTLADFKGRVLLVNLWATWCVPCRKEMPELDHLQGTLGGPEFEVVAINLDTRDPDKPAQFLKETGISHLRAYADPQTRSFQALRGVGRGFGLPTTLLVDRNGCELGYLAGPAAWGGEEAQRLVKAAIAAR